MYRLNINPGAVLSVTSQFIACWKAMKKKLFSINLTCTTFHWLQSSNFEYAQFLTDSTKEGQSEKYNNIENFIKFSRVSLISWKSILINLMLVAKKLILWIAIVDWIFEWCEVLGLTSSFFISSLIKVNTCFFFVGFSLGIIWHFCLFSFIFYSKISSSLNLNFWFLFFIF